MAVPGHQSSQVGGFFDRMGTGVVGIGQGSDPQVGSADLGFRLLHLNSDFLRLKVGPRFCVIGNLPLGGDWVR